MSGLVITATCAATLSFASFVSLLISVPLLYNDLYNAEQSVADEMALYVEESNIMWREIMKRNSAIHKIPIRQKRQCKHPGKRSSTIGQNSQFASFQNFILFCFDLFFVFLIGQKQKNTNCEKMVGEENRKCLVAALSDDGNHLFDFFLFFREH